MKPTVAAFCLLAGASVATFAARALEGGPKGTSSAPSLASAGPTVVDPRDPAVVRLELLARMDSQIDAIATRSRLDARLLLNTVMPLPYLGVDTEQVPGGLSITAVYSDTGAEACGLRKGDVLNAVDGARMELKPMLAKTVRRHQVGDVVSLSIVRDGASLELKATIGPRPEEDEDDTEQFPDLVLPPQAPPASLAFRFDDAPLGSLPPRLTSVLGGHGPFGNWIAVKSERGFALRQDDPDRTGIRFPMVVVDDYSAKDVVARVKFRFAGGRVDRAAGIVLRYRDPGNYLVARANAMEADLRIFRIVNGDRRTLPDAVVKGATDDDRWHTLEFRAVGAELTAVLDGTARTTAYDTYFLRGGVGLWTKADSRTEFDDFELEATR